MPQCTRVMTFDAAHRVLRHESKCASLHGHTYR
jgi:6-pyruvoyl-tetrahydropterin synthase